MNKTAIKSFAIWARNKLIADISYRAGLMGITADGIQKALPQSTGTTEFYDIGTAEPYSISGDAVKQRRHLVELIQLKEKETNYKTAYKYVLEEVAYTWFNRLIAVRFMEVNDYLPSHIRVLSSDSGKMEPDFVTNPFSVGLSFTYEEEQDIYQLKQENKLDEVFRILFIKQCNALNENLPALFEKTSDYTELLLNLSVIDQDGVVYRLVHDIPEEDFDVDRGGQVEIIGWLYQYYNTEPKDETFALLKKNVKITKQSIPAATQVFTPDWIVRYMVENSVGRLWIEGHPNDDLKAGWKYYLEEAEQEPEVHAKLAEIRAEYAKLNPEDIKVIDPCMGSGHILVYAFDVLMQIYESAGYGQRDAARSILENNLYGLDIDDRAFQIAYFAVMMKARQYNRRILNGEYKPNVYSIQESNGINRNQLKYFGADLNDFEKSNAISQMTGLLDAFRDAKEYGSILTVDQYDWDLLDRFVNSIEIVGQMSLEAIGLEDTKKILADILHIGKLLSGKYHTSITNPPYMGAGGMNAKLTAFLKADYPDSKSDLSTVFMEKLSQLTYQTGFVSMINIPVWMFIASYKRLRDTIVRERTLISILHFGRGVFGADFGTVAFAFCNSRIQKYKGTYLRLFDRQSSVDGIETKEQWFFERKGLYITNQDRFTEIPSTGITYWFPDSLFEVFRCATIGDTGIASEGVKTGDNDRYLRLWHEVDGTKFSFATDKQGFKWYPHQKGGDYRKWYGNNDWIINWENDGFEIKNASNSGLQGKSMYFSPVICWPKITIRDTCFRLLPENSLFDSGTPALKIQREKFILGYLNSSVVKFLLAALNPTINCQVGDIKGLPLLFDGEESAIVEALVNEALSISKDEWNDYETSWEFISHPLINKGEYLIEDAWQQWKDSCSKRTSRLKEIEERINEEFIKLYGLGDVISPEVRGEDITLRQASVEKDIKSLISFAVGCMFGRFSLDDTGIAYAGGTWEKGCYKTFIPDEDNVIPITDEEYLEDDVISRFCTWLKVVFGDNTLEQNLDYIANALGNKGNSSREIIRNYFLNDFFKDHCQTYSVTGSGKRPIYWLFDSGKQNGFKALIYLHRYNVDTIGNLRIDYLHRMQRIYESEISRMQDMIDHSTNGREVAQATKRREKLTKQLKECREYDEKLAHLALSRIELDLDDGVKKNYRKIQTANDGKFYEVLADSKNIMSKK